MSTGTKQEVVSIYGKHVLSEEEKKSYSTSLANKQIEKERLVSDKKVFVSTIKGKIDRIESEISQLSESITSGYEFRNQRCRVDLDFNTKTKRFISVETGQVIEERPLEESDYQQEFEM